MNNSTLDGSVGGRVEKRMVFDSYGLLYMGERWRKMNRGEQEKRRAMTDNWRQEAEEVSRD